MNLECCFHTYNVYDILNFIDVVTALFSNLWGAAAFKWALLGKKTAFTANRRPFTIFDLSMRFEFYFQHYWAL